MGATVTLDVNTTSLLGAVGLVDADGRLDPGWFSDPMAAIRRIVADPAQRAALLELLGSLLPDDGDGGSGGPGRERVPLLDPAGRGNIYLTVDGDVVGVCAELATPEGVTPSARIALRLPLVSTAGELRAIAGSAEAPLELSLDLDLGDEVAEIDALAVQATVDVEGNADLRFRLEGVDVGNGPQTLEVSGEHFGRDVVRAVEVLVRDALTGLPDEDTLAAHLLGALGLDGVLPPLALDELAADATRLRAWLTQLAATPAHLEAWFAHVAGLLGAEPPTATEPLAARIALLGDGADLVLRLELAGATLALCLDAVAAGAAARLQASATLLAIPLDPAEPVRVVPRTALALRAPGGAGALADAAPEVRVGWLAAGIAFDGAGLVPELLAHDVVLNGVAYPSIDLTDANAVVDAGSAAIRDAIEAAVGRTTGPARALLALLGVAAPASDPATPHLIDVAALARSPTAAIADVHRAVLADAEHGWSHMLRAIGDLLGLEAGAPAGTGTAADPWRLALAGGDGGDGGGVRLDLAAWDARDDATPAGERRLRVGLLLSAGEALDPWTPRVRSELLAFDLPPAGAAAVRLIGEQRVELELSPVPEAVSETSWLTVRASALRGVLTWRPGVPVAITAQVDDLRVTGPDGDELGPFTLAFPPADTGGPDLGLGGAPEELLEALRRLARHALQEWGGDGARALGELLGIFGDGPRLDPPDLNDLGSLLGRPGDALREHLRRLATELGDDDEPHAERALATLTALLRDRVARARDGFTPRLDVAIGGTGTYADPWALPLDRDADDAGDAAAGVELLLWLDPAGPPASWASALAARVAATTDGRALTALLPRLTAFASGLPEWATPDGLGDALDELGGWLAGGDGTAALTSQLPDLPGWRHGDVLTSPHADQPGDPLAIAQIAAQLEEWAGEAGERAVLLVGPAWSDHAIWDELLAAVEPDRDADAHFDLRGGRRAQSVTALATHYTVDLLDDASGDLDALAAQLSAAVDRVRVLTGIEHVAVVAHSTAGIAARVLAGARSEVIRGLVTLGTAHAGDVPLALTDPRLADAVRAVRAIIGGGADGGGAAAVSAGVRAALAALDTALDRTAGAIVPSAFVPVPPGTPNPVPGLALGSALGGNLVASLRALLASAVTAAAAARDPGSAPTHLGLGARVRLPIGAEDADGVRLDVDARIDGARLALTPGAPAPERPARALYLRAFAARPGGWLVGEPAGDGPRIRSAELGLSLVAGAGGTVSAAPRLLLRDVVLGAARRDLELGDDGLGAALDLLSTALGSSATGADLAGLAALVQSPAAVLREQRDALLDALEQELGGELAVRLAHPPLELALDRATWTLRLRSTLPWQVADGVGASLDAGLSLTTFIPTLEAGLLVGVVELDYATARGTLRLSAPPWLDPLTVAPAPPAAQLRAALAPLVPRVALSAALSAALGELLDARATVRALDRVFADPGAALAQLTPADVQDVLRSTARALGTDDSAGLGLPGGLLLRAAGTDALRLELTGTLTLADAGDVLALGLTLDVAADRSVTPGGSLALDVGLPGDWGRVAVAFAATPAGVSLVVTPQGVEPIALLPTFSGFGALLGATARKLLPQLLQALVDELRPASGPPTGLLAATLDLATALGVYADDARGFEEPARAARLAAMLEPGWLGAQTADAAQLAALIDAILDAAPPPIGVVAVAGTQITWSAPLPIGGGQLAATVTLGSDPAATLTLTNFDAGPLVVQRAHAGYAAGALAFDAVLRLDPAGDLAFLTPVVELGVSGAGLAAGLLPLGPARRADLELRLAPDAGLTVTAAGALGLVKGWGLPLVTLLGLRSAGEALERRLWSQGPTARRVLSDAGVVTPVGPPKPAPAMPDLPAISLGALKALATDMSVAVTPTLALAIVDDGTGRKGLRLKGRQDVAGSAIDASVRFGEADWLEEPDAGVTLWLVRPATGTPPVALDLALDAIGIGAVFGAPGDEPLIDGIVTIGRAGGLLFFALDFLDAAGRPALTASGLGAALELHDAQIDVRSSDGDGFLQKILPDSLQAPFSLAVEARAGRGVELHGGPPDKPGAGAPGANPLELRIPLDTQIGPVELLDLVVGLRKPAAGGAELVAGVDARGALGPVKVSVQNVGARARLTGDAPGELGVELAFKTPDGAALRIDAGAVVGAGFLAHDAARSQYAGGVDLEFAKLRLSAIGLLATKLPDGRPGFSLLVVINARFPQPIPLGFGFNLAAVGGIVGINRAVDVVRLRGGMREGSLSTILSPGDVVGNERRLLSELGELFPVTPGRHLFGPTASLTWGTPTIVTVDIALALELPQPLRFIAAGRVRLALPDARKPIAEINLDALGVLDTGAGTLELDATLYDSQIAGWQLSGDMALRARWTRPSQFVMSAGGFHPRFKPPPAFPVLRRMALSIGEGKVWIRMEAYLALTTNTLQLGSRVQLHAESGDFVVAGHFGFDALVRFSPFGFEFDLSIGLSLRWKGRLIAGLTADLYLTGPGRWYVRGKVTVEVLFLSATVRFEGSFGRAQRIEPVPTQPVLQLVHDALKSVGAWEVQERAPLPALTIRQGISLQELLVSPSALVTVRQKVAPLGATHLDRLGEARIAGPAELRVQQAMFGARPTDFEDVKDEFAPAQYFDMTDEEKLSSPAFDLMSSGVRFAATESLTFDGDGPGAIVIGYQTLIVDAPDAPLRAAGHAARTLAAVAGAATAPDFELGGDELARLAYDGAAGRAATRATGLGRFAAPGLDVRVEPDAFLVVSAATLAPAGPQPDEGVRWSRSEAQQRLRRWRATHPQDGDDLIVVPAHEAAPAVAGAAAR